MKIEGQVFVAIEYVLKLDSGEEANDLAIVLRSGSLPAMIAVREAQLVPPVR